MRSGQCAEMVHTPHYLHCDVDVDLQRYILRLLCWMPLQQEEKEGGKKSSFLQTHNSVACVTCLSVTDEILSADAGVVLWGAG